jgi:phage gp36-like protein
MSNYIDSDYYKAIFSNTIYSTIIQGSRSVSEASARFLLFATQADEKIDSYLNNVYELPLSPVPEEIKIIAARLIHYNASVSNGNIRESDKNEYENIIMQLEKFRDRKLEIMNDNELQEDYYPKRIVITNPNIKAINFLEKMKREF